MVDLFVFYLYDTVTNAVYPAVTKNINFLFYI